MALERPPPLPAEGEALATGQLQRERRQVGWLLATLALLLVLIVAGYSLGGEVARLAEAGIPYLPFVVLAALLHLRFLWPPFRLLAWVWFWLVLAGFGLLTLATVVGALDPSFSGDLPPGGRGQVLLTLALVAVALLGGAWLARNGRWARLANALGGRVNPATTAHAQGLVGLVVFSVTAVIPLVVLGGEAPFLRSLAQDSGYFETERDPGGQVLDLYYGLAWTVPLALLLVGFPARRGLAATLQRLGLRRPRRVDLALAPAVALAMLLLAYGLDLLVQPIWRWAGWPVTDSTLVDELFTVATSPAGAFAAALTAGMGEELLARGVLQPRYGWLLPNLAFTATHAFQYGPDALVSIFALGMALAAARARRGTTLAMLSHALYDLALFLAPLLGLPDF